MRDDENDFQRKSEKICNISEFVVWNLYFAQERNRHFKKIMASKESDSGKKASIEKKITERQIQQIILTARGPMLIALYTVLLIGVFSIIPYYAYNNIQDCILRQFCYVSSAGGFGGIAYSITSLTPHLIKNNFSMRYKWWYFFRPFTAVILGVFSFILIAGGVMNLSTSSDIPENICSTAKGIMFYCSVAFLAGYSSQSFADKLISLSTALFK